MAQGHQILYHYNIIYFYYSNNNIVKFGKYQLQVFPIWNVFEIFNTKCFWKNFLKYAKTKGVIKTTSVAISKNFSVFSFLSNSPTSAKMSKMQIRRIRVILSFWSSFSDLFARFMFNLHIFTIFKFLKDGWIRPSRMLNLNTKR